MDLETGIKDIISKKLEDGTVEKLIGEQLEKGIVKALDNILGNYGDVTKVIEERLSQLWSLILRTTIIANILLN